MRISVTRLPTRGAEAPTRGSSERNSRKPRTRLTGARSATHGSSKRNSRELKARLAEAQNATHGSSKRDSRKPRTRLTGAQSATRGSSKRDSRELKARLTGAQSATRGSSKRDSRKPRTRLAESRMTRRADLLLGIATPLVTYWVLTTLGASDWPPWPGARCSRRPGCCSASRARGGSTCSRPLARRDRRGPGRRAAAAQHDVPADQGLARAGVLGLGSLGSLLARRPLPVVLLRGRPAAAEAFEARWADPGFRRALRGITIVWGCALLAEAGLRVVRLCSCHRGC
jgi:hypothetical protein